MDRDDDEPDDEDEDGFDADAESSLDEGLDDDDDDEDPGAGDPDEDDELFDGDVDGEASVSCPYCGETTLIGLDHGSGAVQEYVEDCEVCCRPWRVRVRYDRRGTAEVTIDPA